jgi:uncharacterized protein involved in outer membrane biogenesis
MKTILKWFFALVLLLAVLAGVFLLSLDTLLRVTAEHRIRAQTGMDAEIGKFHLGLLEPVITIKDLAIHNPPAFGGTPFLSIPEIHVEYDRAALLKNQLHLTLLRFNLGELDIVKNEAGQTNLFALGVGVPLPAKPAPDGGQADLKIFKQRTGLDFAGIDVLNVSLGAARFIDLKNPANNREQKFGIDNLVLKNIKSPADLTGLTLLVALRGGDFFKNVFGSGLSF